MRIPILSAGTGMLSTRCLPRLGKTMFESCAMVRCNPLELTNVRFLFLQLVCLRPVLCRNPTVTVINEHDGPDR